MNPDCQYCGLEDGSNKDHECDSNAMKRMIDNLYEEIRLMTKAIE